MMRLARMTILGLIILLFLTLNSNAQIQVFHVVNETHVEVTNETIFTDGDTDTLLVAIGITDFDCVKIRSTDESVFTIDSTSRSLSYTRNQTFEIDITAEFIGIESIEFFACDTDTVIADYTVKVRRQPTWVSTAFTVVLLIWLVISYISMGALITWDELQQRLFPPWRLIIGMVCQFFIMPFLTFVMASALPVSNEAAIGIILVGTCPGGWLSNIFSVLLNVDFILSVTMTFFSSVFALFMMPFNIWLYTSGFVGDNENLTTPFGDLFLQLLILVVSCVVGRLIGWKFEKFKVFCEKVLKPVAVLLIVFGLALGIPADIHMFYSPWPLWVAALATPFIGAYFGLSLSRIFAINIKSSVTVALETGVQNALLARTVVYLFYPQPEGDLIGRVQTLTVLITLIEGVILCIIVNLVLFFRKRGKKELGEPEGSPENGGIENKSFNNDLPPPYEHDSNKVL